MGKSAKRRRGKCFQITKKEAPLVSLFVSTAFYATLKAFGQ